MVDPRLGPHQRQDAPQPVHDIAHTHARAWRARTNTTHRHKNTHNPHTRARARAHAHTHTLAHRARRALLARTNEGIPLIVGVRTAEVRSRPTARTGAARYCWYSRSTPRVPDPKHEEEDAEIHWQHVLDVRELLRLQQRRVRRSALARVCLCACVRWSVSVQGALHLCARGRVRA